MESNIYPQRPDWLTDEKVEFLRERLKICPVPLSDEEIKHWKYDGFNDPLKANSRTAFDILSKYGLLEETK